MKPETIILLSTLLIPTACAIVAKIMPREKLADLIWSVLSKMLIALQAVLLGRFGKKAADVLEETVFVTIFYAIEVNCKRARDFLHANNEEVKQ